MPTGRTGLITALAPWFGAKRTLAPAIVRQLGPHRCYWEPFCGSIAVLLSKPPCNQETVNDLHGDLVNLARVVRDEHLSAKLYWRLRRTLAAEGLFRESFAVVRASPAPPWDGSAGEQLVERAYHYFVASWLGLNGVSGTPKFNTNFARRYSSKGGDSATRFVSAVESLPDWHQRLRSVEIYSACGIALCERIEDREGTVIYADPPYFEAGAKYQHHFTPADHERLAAALCRFVNTRVVLSYYRHPELDRLYPCWHRIDLARARKLHNAMKKPPAERTDAPEVLLINDDPMPEE